MEREQIKVNLESTSNPYKHFKYGAKNISYKCDCCGRLVDHVNALCSGIVAMSFAYCDGCARKNVEPYNVLVSQFADEISENKWNDLTTYWQKVIKDSCKVSGHTLKQFFQDCNNCMDDCKNWSDRL